MAKRLLQCYIHSETSQSSQASEGSSSEALALVDSILFQIDPSLVSKAKEATGESAKVSTEQEACDTALATAKTGTASPPSASVVHEEEVIDQDKSVRRSSSQHISLISRSSSQELQGLAGKAIVRKYDVYTTDETSRSLKRVSNPILVARPTLSSTSKTKVSSGSSPPSPNSALSTSAEASPTQTRFLNIAGRSLRDKATAARVEQSKVSNANDPRKLSERQNGRPSIFNKTSIRPSVPPPTRRNHASSESEGSPPTNRNATYRTRSTIPSSRSPSHSHYRASVTGGSVRRSPGKATELPKIHKWDLDETEKPPKFIQGRYISSGEIVDPLASMRKADFTGYQNGWKPIESRSVGGRQSDGYVLGGGSFDRRDRFTHEDQGDGEEEDSNPTPLHWRGDVDSEVRLTFLNRAQITSFITDVGYGP